MPIYYVYLNFFRQAEPGLAGIHRQILACESRYVADEFFRALQDLNELGRKWYTVLERNTPQFWYYDTIEGSPTLLVILRATSLQRFGSSVALHTVADVGGISSPVIPVVDGPDWVNNGTYFIRNKRQPELYWHHHDGYVHVSGSQKSKFRIRATAFAQTERKVLTLQDQIHISLCGDYGSDRIYLTNESSSSKVAISHEARSWRFSDLVRNFGTTVVAGDVQTQEFVTWVDDNENGDEWELC